MWTLKIIQHRLRSTILYLSHAIRISVFRLLGQICSRFSNHTINAHVTMYTCARRCVQHMYKVLELPRILPPRIFFLLFRDGALDGKRLSFRKEYEARTST